MTIATLRDISVVLIALELFVMLLLPVAILYFSVRGMNWVRAKLCYVFPIIQSKFRQVAEISDKASRKAAAPLIAVDAFTARVRGMKKAL